MSNTGEKIDKKIKVTIFLKLLVYKTVSRVLKYDPFLTSGRRS